MEIQITAIFLLYMCGHLKISTQSFYLNVNFDPVLKQCLKYRKMIKNSHDHSLQVLTFNLL